MNPFRAIAKSFADTYRLEPPYVRVTVGVGLVGCLGGIGLMYLAAPTLARFLEIDWDGPLLRQSNGPFAHVVFFLAIPVSIYLGCAFVAGALGAVMVGLKKMNASEAVRYALIGQHPQSWRRLGKNPRRRPRAAGEDR